MRASSGLVSVAESGSQEQLGLLVEQRVTDAITTTPDKEHIMSKQHANTTNPMPITRNEGWGFHGTMREHAAQAWPLAMAAVSNATGASLESVRLFLDSGFGRHFADEVLDALLAGQTLAGAINTITSRWMARRIGSRTSQTYGIPRGLPHLAGFVAACEIEEDCLAA